MEKIDLKKVKINHKKVNFFRFKEFNNQYLLTNDFGGFIFLSPEEFKLFLEGKTGENTLCYKGLVENGFIKDNFNVNSAIDIFQKKNNALFHGPSLHIVVLTLRCNANCIYCQASSKGMGQEGFDMSKETAKKTLDLIFNTAGPLFALEFQGGEPLVNWPMVKFFVEESKKLEKKTGKKVQLALVSNLTLMTEEKLDFLIKNKVALCTSLDGPEDIHNKNRPIAGVNHYKKTTYWIKKIKSREEELAKKRDYPYKLNALVTITKHSISNPKKIIDEYVRLGLNGIFLRPLSSLGYSSGALAKSSFGYSAEEFTKFWKEGVDYIFSLNRRGINFRERGVSILSKKIFGDSDPGYTDLRSPCGAVIGQVLYNYDGKIYTCDEGRMTESDDFIIGNVEDDMENIFRNDKIEMMIKSSCLDNLTCDNCVYKPYCGVCPVKNLSLHNTMFPRVTDTDYCRINRFQFDYIFDKIRNVKDMETIKKWGSFPKIL